MPAEAFHKFFPGVVVALRTALLEAIYRRKRTDFAAQGPIPAVRIAYQKTAAKGITNARRVNNFLFRDRGDETLLTVRIQSRTIFPARHDQNFDMLKDMVQIPAGLFRDQIKLVIVAE